MTSTPNERAHARTRWSDAALVAEYALDGRYAVSSVKRCGSSRARSPNTSSVDTWWNPVPCRRAASSSVYVPTTLVCTNGHGSRRELSLWDSAAKWTTASAAPIRSSTTPASAMPPTTSSQRAESAAARFSRLPA